MSQYPITAEMVARAVVAAALKFGEDPATALTGRQASVAAACSGLQRATGAPLKATAKLLGRVDTTVLHARKRGSETFRAAEDAARKAVEAIIARDGLHPVAPAPQADKPRKTRVSSSRTARLSHRVSIRQLQAVNPRKVRYSRRFLDAGWPIGEVAELFDVDENALQVALGR